MVRKESDIIKIKISELEKIKGVGDSTINKVKKHIREKKMNEKEVDLNNTITNKVYSGDNINVLKERVADNSIDLVVTSPPYEDLRDYGGDFNFDYKKLLLQLYRVMKKGGVVVWVVNDKSKNGSESGESFRQALYAKNIGFNLHDTMIYSTGKFPQNQDRYEQKFEYMFVFSKDKPKTFNPIKVKSKWHGDKPYINKRLKNGEQMSGNKYKVKKFKVKGNIWNFKSGNNKSTLDEYAYQHPAIFPEELAKDHIKSWSNEGDIVLDPMCGSGTTLKMAKKLNRKYIGIDINKKYCSLSRKRVEEVR